MKNIFQDNQFCYLDQRDTILNIFFILSTTDQYSETDLEFFPRTGDLGGGGVQQHQMKIERTFRHYVHFFRNVLLIISDLGNENTRFYDSWQISSVT